LLRVGTGFQQSEPRSLPGCEIPGEFLGYEKALGYFAVLDDLHGPMAVYLFD
jgi:hypothetical protein